MLKAEGHEAILYAGPQSHGEYTEHVEIVSNDDRRRWYGEESWRGRVFDRWEPADPCWTEMGDRAISAIRERLAPRDIIGIIAGRCQEVIVNAFPNNIAWEWGIGYAGVLENTHKVFESYAWLNHVSGLRKSDDMRFFDGVIPNSFEASEFPAGDGAGGYYLFMGRLTPRKGPQIAAEACKRIGAKLLVAGQGATSYERGNITIAGGMVLGGDIEYVGVASPDERAKLMGDAIATFVPTTYLEPFGGVAVESMLTGTPAITTDHGAFVETVAQGISGYRGRMLSDFVAAAEAAPHMDRRVVRDYAMNRYTTDVVAPQYGAFLDRLETLWGDGWYAGA